MSIQAVSWVLEHSKATLGARLALISIANNADKRGENSCPGFSTIAEEACFSRRAAVTAVAKLLEEKHVEVTGVDPKYKTNIYRVLGMSPSEETSPSTPEMASEETSLRGEESSPAPSEETSRGGEAASEVDDKLLPITRLPIKTKELERATKKRCGLPTNLIPDQTTAAVAADLGLNLTAELAHFRDHHTAKGTVMVDWQAGIRTWLHRAHQFRPKGPPDGKPPQGKNERNFQEALRRKQEVRHAGSGNGEAGRVPLGGLPPRRMEPQQTLIVDAASR